MYYYEDHMDRDLYSTLNIYLFARIRDIIYESSNII